MNDFPFQHLKLYRTSEEAYSELDLIGNKNSDNLIILSDEYEKEIFDYLEKILASVGLDYHIDIQIITLKTGRNLKISKLPHHKILVFGIEPKNLGLFVEWELYSMIRIGNKKLIFSNDLTDIFAERVKKERKMAMMLWNSLKEMFL
jgi:hypothetical protein